jgi:uncharacterized repeat protein (TIGR01451 family)
MMPRQRRRCFAHPSSRMRKFIERARTVAFAAALLLAIVPQTLRAQVGWQPISTADLSNAAYTVAGRAYFNNGGGDGTSCNLANIALKAIGTCGNQVPANWLPYTGATMTHYLGNGQAATPMVFAPGTYRIRQGGGLGGDLAGTPATFTFFEFNTAGTVTGASTDRSTLSGAQDIVVTFTRNWGFAVDLASNAGEAVRRVRSNESAPFSRHFALMAPNNTSSVSVQSGLALVTPAINSPFYFGIEDQACGASGTVTPCASDYDNNDITFTFERVGAGALDLTPRGTLSSSSVAQGGTVAGNVRLVNVGGPSTSTTAATLRITLPTWLTFTTGSGTLGTGCSVSSQVLTCTRTQAWTYADSVSGTLNFNVATNAPVGATTLRAIAAHAEDTNAPNDTLSLPLTITALPTDLAVANIGVLTDTLERTFAAPAWVVVRHVSGATTSDTASLTISTGATSGVTIGAGTLPAGWTCGATGASLLCKRGAGFAATGRDSLPLTIGSTLGTPTPFILAGRISLAADNVPANDSLGRAVVARAPSSDLAVRTPILPGTTTVGIPAQIRVPIANITSRVHPSGLTVTFSWPTGRLTPVTGPTPGWSCGTATTTSIACTRSATFAGLGTDTLAFTATVVGTDTVPVRAIIAPTSGWTDVVASNDTSRAIIRPVAAPALDVAVTALQADSLIRGGPGGAVTATVANVGATATTDSTIITFASPTGITLGAPTSATGWTCAFITPGARCARPAGWASGATSTITLTAFASASAASGNPLTATIATSGDAVATNNARSVNVLTRAQVVDYAVTTFRDDTLPLLIGDTASVTVRIQTVAGPGVSDTLTLQIPRPAGLANATLTAPPEWTCVATTTGWTCTRTTPLALNATSAIRVRGTITGASVAITPTLNGSNDSQTNNNTATVTIAARQPTPDLRVAKALRSDSLTTNVGSVADWAIRVTNAGTTRTQDSVVVVDSLPIGLTALSATSTRGTCTTNPRLVRCVTPAPFNIGDSLTIGVQTRIDSVGALQNIAVASTNGEVTAANNRAFANIRTRPASVLEIAHRAIEGTASAGDWVTWEIRVRSPGGPQPNVTLTDLFPIGFRPDPNSAREGSASRAATTNGRNVALVLPGVVDTAWRTIRIRTRVITDVLGVQTAFASGTTAQGRITGPVPAAVTLVRDVLRERGLIAGTVSAGDVGIPGVRVWMEDGRSAVTDGEGRFSIPNVDARAHLVQVDLRSLPEGVTLSSDGIRRFAGGSAATVHVLPGELAVVKFSGTKDDAATTAIAARRARARERIDNGYGAGDTGAGGAWSLPLERRYASLATRITAPIPSTGRTQREIPAGVDRDTVAGSIAVVMQQEPAPGMKPTFQSLTIESRGGAQLAPNSAGGARIVAPLRGTSVNEPALRISGGDQSIVIPVPPARLDTASLRAWRVSGIGQMRVGRGGAMNQFIDSSWTEQIGDGPWRSTGRAALVADGWLGRTRVGARFDTEQDQLGFAPGALLQPGIGYTLLGDAALRGQAMPTRAMGALTVRHDGFGLQAGDVQIRDLLPNSIAPLDRRVTGVSAEVTGKRGGMMAYAAPTRGRVVVEELQGRGVSGPYRLTQPQGLIPQSERIVLVTRDRTQPALVVRTRDLQRFQDYNIDPATGTIIFANPVPSRDADLNPVSVRITSETTMGALGMSGGAAVAFRLAPKIEIGLSAARDDASGGNTLDLGSVNVTMALSPSSLVELEVAGTNDAGRRGNALRFGARSAGKSGETTVQYQRASTKWNWQQSLLPASREEAVVRVMSPELWAHSRIDAEALHSADITDGAGSVRGSQTASLGVSTIWSRFVRSRFAVGGAHTDSIGLRPYALGRLSLHRDSTGGPSIWLEGARAVNDDASRVAVGASAPVAFRTSVYVQHEYRTGWATNVLPGPLGIAQRSTVAGVRSDAWSRVTPYGEYRARQGITALEAVAAIGVRGMLPLRPGLTMTLAGEQVSNLSNVDSLRKTVAMSTGAEWTGSPLGTFAFRTDWRGTNVITNEWGGSAGLTRSWSEAWTTLARSQWVVTPGTTHTVRSQLAGAWRQPGGGKWNWLGRVEHWADRGALGAAGDPSQQAAQAGVNPVGERQALIVSSALTVTPTPLWMVSWRGALKSVRDRDPGDAWLTSGGWLNSGRVLRSFGTGGWDAGAHGTLFGVGSTIRTSAGAELGRRVMDGLRLAVGANLIGSPDREFSSVQPTQRGIYLDVTWGIAAQGVARRPRR